MENSSVASASSEAGSTRSQEIEELERFIDSYVLEYQVQGLLGDKSDGDLDLDNGGKVPQVRALSFKWMLSIPWSISVRSRGYVWFRLWWFVSSKTASSVVVMCI